MSNLIVAKKGEPIPAPIRPEIENPLRRAWAELVWRCIRDSTHFYNKHRKFIPNVHWTLPWSVCGAGLDIGLKDMFYTEYKRGQLFRNYFNVDNIDGVCDRMKERIKGKKNAATFMAFLGNQAKSEKSLGFCIQCLGITYLPPNDMHIHVAYRTTELVQKFGADLVFLFEDVIPHVQQQLMTGKHSVKIREVSFHFPSINISSMYMPTMVGWLFEPITFLERLKEVDEDFWYYATRFIQIWLHEESTWTYKQRQLALRNMNTLEGLGLIDREELEVYCKEHFEHRRVSRGRR